MNLSVDQCKTCGMLNVLDNRAPKCPHFCHTCSSTERRLAVRAAGSPPMAQDASDTCRTCGVDAVGTDFDAWVRPTFTDHDKLTGGKYRGSALFAMALFLAQRPEETEEKETDGN